MVRNDERRLALADAGIQVLADEGARGLTHRAVDAAAGVPRGTASNYFSTRNELVVALVQRIEERLTPDEAVLAELARRTPDRALFAEYLQDVVRRLTADRRVTLALFELRLEATRRPDVAETLGRWRRRSFEGDVRFTEEAGLPGNRLDLALIHHAIDGLVLDHLTVPIEPGLAMETAVRELVERLLP